MKLTKALQIAIMTGVLLVPLLVSAQALGNLPNAPVVDSSLDLCGLITLIEQIVWVVFTAIVVVATVVVGILFVTSQGNAEKVTAARNGVLGIVVVIVIGVLAYGIINIVASAIGASAGQC